MHAMTAQEIWNHIESHQDDDFETIAKDCGITEDMARKLVIQWATGNKPMFEETLFTHKADVIVDEETGQREVTITSALGDFD